MPTSVHKTTNTDRGAVVFSVLALVNAVSFMLCIYFTNATSVDVTNVTCTFMVGAFMCITLCNLIAGLMLLLWYLCCKRKKKIKNFGFIFGVVVPIILAIFVLVFSSDCSDPDIDVAMIMSAFDYIIVYTVLSIVITCILKFCDDCANRERVTDRELTVNRNARRNTGRNRRLHMILRLSERPRTEDNTDDIMVASVVTTPRSEDGTVIPVAERVEV